MLKSGLSEKLCELFDQEWRQIFAIITAALVSLNTNLLYAWPSPSIPILLSDNFPDNVTMEEASYTTVIPALASILSSPLYPYLMDRFGRIPTLLSVTMPQFIAWILISQAKSVYTIYISRFLSGFASSCLYAAVPVYISEISSPKIRGLWGNAMSFCAYFGLCLMTTVGSFLSMQNCAYIFSGLGVLFFIMLIFMPESPYFYIMKGDYKKALDTLKQVRKNEGVEEEFDTIVVAVRRQLKESSRFVDLFIIRSNLKGLLIAVSVRGCQQFAGISAFSVYAQYIFLEVDEHISATLSSIIYSSTLMLGCFTGSIFLDRLGRKMAMVISCAGCSLILFSECAYFYYSKTLLAQYSLPLHYFPLIGMITYVIVYTLGLGIVPNLLLGELFPSGVKGKALGIVNICFGIFSAVSTKVFQVLFSNFGIYAPFLLFSLCCACNTIFSIFCIPETSGKTLEEIQMDLKKQKEPEFLKTRC